MDLIKRLVLSFCVAIAWEMFTKRPQGAKMFNIIGKNILFCKPQSLITKQSAKKTSHGSITSIFIILLVCLFDFLRCHHDIPKANPNPGDKKE